MNKHDYSGEITIKLLKSVFKSSCIYSGIFFLVYFIAKYACSFYTWHYDDTTYQLLLLFTNPFVVAIIWVVGILIIMIIGLKKSLAYINKIIDVCQELTVDNTERIILPKELEEIEDKMNLIKQEAIVNLKLAKDNEKKKNDLIVYLAHDIKTPLTSMIGYLSLLNEVEDMPKKQQKKYINIALEKSYRLDSLINELFDITRFNAGKIILEKEDLNLNIMLEQIIDDFYPTLKELNKKIELNMQGKIIINADSDKLARVFNNVIKNAIFYSYDETNILIDVEKDDKNVVIKIVNKGKLIPKQKLDKIFEKFYRLDNSRTSKTGGSGLGLAIAKEIVELHDGTITATSDTKQTVFTIVLPTD